MGLEPLGRSTDMFKRLWRGANGLTLADLGEKLLLGDYLLPLAESLWPAVGLGDDSGVLPIVADADLIITTDRVPTDLLARQYDLMTPELFGRYTIRVCVSDLCAMGAQPAGLVVTSAFPSPTSVRYVLELMWGLYSEGYALGVPVVGGDTKWANDESVSATAVGFAPRGDAWRRSNASPGDRVCVTGPVGTAGAGLRWFGSSGDLGRLHPDDLADLRSAIVSPVPRTDIVDELRGTAAVTACMDITDGLGQSLLELGSASGVRLVIDEDALPLSRATLAVARALDIDPVAIVGGIGLDLQLLVATRSDVPLPSGLIQIGVVETGDGVRLRGASASDREFPITGFQHFRQRALDIAQGKPT